MKARVIKPRIIEYFVHANETHIYRIRNHNIEYNTNGNPSRWKVENVLLGYGQQQPPTIEERRQGITMGGWHVVSEEAAYQHLAKKMEEQIAKGPKMVFAAGNANVVGGAVKAHAVQGKVYINADGQKVYEPKPYEPKPIAEDEIAIPVAAFYGQADKAEKAIVAEPYAWPKANPQPEDHWVINNNNQVEVDHIKPKKGKSKMGELMEAHYEYLKAKEKKAKNQQAANNVEENPLLA